MAGECGRVFHIRQQQGTMQLALGRMIWMCNEVNKNIDASSGTNKHISDLHDQ